MWRNERAIILITVAIMGIVATITRHTTVAAFCLGVFGGMGLADVPATRGLREPKQG